MAGVSLNMLVYDTFESFRGKIANSDSIDRRELKYNWHNQRALHLRNELNKPGHVIDPAFIQDLGCIDLETASASDCCLNNISCNIKRTTVDVPNTIERHNQTSLVRVGPINKLQTPFTLINYSEVPYAGNGRANGNSIFAFLHEKRIYLIQRKKTTAFIGMSRINIAGVFENPEDALLFKQCDGTTCYSDDSPYPINRWLIPYIQQQLFAIYSKVAFMPSDDSQDNKHNLETGQPK